MDGKHIYIFSYGSNMLFQRIYERIESVEVVDVHELHGYRLVFNKISHDGSMKANIQETRNPNDSVWGVIHRIAIHDKRTLDKFEGLGKGYLPIDFKLSVAGENRSIHSYIATEDAYLEEGKPYDWYLNFVIAGAIENGFPEGYIKNLKSIDAVMDLNDKRRKKNEEILQKII